MCVKFNEIKFAHKNNYGLLIGIIFKPKRIGSYYS